MQKEWWDRQAAIKWEIIQKEHERQMVQMDRALEEFPGNEKLSALRESMVENFERTRAFMSIPVRPLSSGLSSDSVDAAGVPDEPSKSIER